MVNWLPNLQQWWSWLRAHLTPRRRLVESRAALPHHAMARRQAPEPNAQEPVAMSSTSAPSSAPSPSPNPAPASGSAGSASSSQASGPADYTSDSRLVPVTCAILTGLFTNAADRPAMLAKEAVETAKLVLAAIDADSQSQNPAE